MAAPEYLICLSCETPCYTFEWEDEGTTEALCDACGNVDPEQFVTPDEFDALAIE